MCPSVRSEYCGISTRTRTSLPGTACGWPTGCRRRWRTPTSSWEAWPATPGPGAGHDPGADRGEDVARADGGSARAVSDAAEDPAVGAGLRGEVRAHHRFMLGLLLDQVEHLERQVRSSMRIEAVMSPLRKRRRRCSMRFPASTSVRREHPGRDRGGHDTVWPRRAIGRLGGPVAGESPELPAAARAGG